MIAIRNSQSRRAAILARYHHELGPDLEELEEQQQQAARVDKDGDTQERGGVVRPVAEMDAPTDDMPGGAAEDDMDVAGDYRNAAQRLEEVCLPPQRPVLS